MRSPWCAARTGLVATALGVLLSTSIGQSQTAVMLHVGTIPIEPAALVYYAKDEGFFDKAGLNVEIEANPSTPALASAVASGTLDVSYATIPTLAVAHTKNLPFVIIAPGIVNSAEHFGGAIVVPTGSTLKTGKDFNGKTLGAAGLNTIAEYLPRAWIDKHGGDSSTVKFIEIPFPETPDALASGRVDAAYLAEPFVTIAERRKVARVLTTGDDAVAAEFLATAWFTTAPWAKAHPELVSRFGAAMHDAAVWANANPSKVIPMLQKYLKADPALTAQTRRPYYAERLVPALVQPYIDVTAKYAKFAPFPAAELIYVPAR